MLDIFGSGDRVTSRYVSTGTYLGAFWGLPPTGRRIEVHQISTLRCPEGRGAEQWCIRDELARLQQLGADDAQLRRTPKP